MNATSSGVSYVSDSYMQTAQSIHGDRNNVNEPLVHCELSSFISFALSFAVISACSGFVHSLIAFLVLLRASDICVCACVCTLLCGTFVNNEHRHVQLVPNRLQDYKACLSKMYLDLLHISTVCSFC